MNLSQLHRSARLIEFLQSNPLPWLYYDPKRSKFIMIVDNHLLSTYRSCAQHFYNRHVLGLARKPMKGKPSRVWFLEFGICLHAMLEYYYKHFRDEHFDPIDFGSTAAARIWMINKMDEFSEEKEFKSIGGKMGFMGLCTQYAFVLTPENEKLRVLATEVAFGKRKEVILYSDEYLEVYLSGRIDILVDDGYFICPLDHKSKAYFGQSDLTLEHALDEGPTGYIYALKAILPQIVPPDMILKRDCSKILMNYISKKPTERPQDRFRRIPLRKTEWQLEQYRLRQVATAQALLEDMERVAFDMPISRDAGMCRNWFHRDCVYLDICRQGSREGELVTISNGFQKVPIWDTETVGQENNNAE